MKRTLWAVLIAGALAVPGWAQNYEEGDDPDHGVARLSLLNGDVSVRRGDTGETVAGELNAPLVALDHILTGPGSRAEVQFDWANMIRLGPVSEVRLGELTDSSYLVQVAEGTTTFRILRDSRVQVEISTPTVSVRPIEKGVYRITVRPDGATEITVRSGEAEIFTPRGSERLRSGKTMEARGTAADPEFMIISASGKDDWDRWNEDRDRDLERSKSYQYVSRDVYGADDLDGYGRWVYDSPYGWVWVPNVATTWAPYRIGRWSWVNYYGWTWISGDPWGWAPYHYGRWYSSPYGWAWYPGAVGYRYWWRPALVGFFGWGNASVSIGFGWGFGNVGWVPLAPYEIYRPWYGPRFRNTTINNITIVNNTNITNVYRNARQFNGRNGVTSVNATNFGRTRVNGDNYVRAGGNDLTRAGQVQGQIPFTQDRDSRRFSDRAPGADTVARSSRERPVQFATNVDRGRRGAAAGASAGTVGVPSTAPAQRGSGVERSGVDRANGNVGNRGGEARDGGALTTPGQTGGWRRFDNGPSRGSTYERNAGVNGAGRVDSSRDSNRDINGFSTAPRDSRRQATEAVPRTQTEPRSDRGFNTDRGATANQGGFSDRRATMDRGNVGRSAGGGIDTGSRRSSPSQPVQINPPIVRDRGSSAGGGGFDTRRSAPSNPGGGGIRSAPPSGGGPVGGGIRSAPSAPPSNPGGGSIRSSGGGNGGMRGAAPAGNPGGGGGSRGGGGGGGNPGGGGGGGGRRR